MFVYIKDSDAIARDVDSVADEYLRKGEIPFSLLQAKLLRCHYYQLKFVPELLKPRLVPFVLTEQFEINFSLLFFLNETNFFSLVFAIFEGFCQLFLTPG